MTLQDLNSMIDHKTEVMNLEMHRGQIAIDNGEMTKANNCLKICMRLSSDILELEDQFMAAHSI
jgi:hypothetical protein